MAGRKTVATKSKYKMPVSDIAALIGDALCLCQDTIITEINQAGLSLLGFQGKDSPIGRPLSDFVASDEKKKLSKNLSSLTRNKTAQRLDVAGIDGRVWPADVKAAKIDGPKK